MPVAKLNAYCWWTIYGYALHKISPNKSTILCTYSLYIVAFLIRLYVPIGILLSQVLSELY